jgi:hypothetical protein
MIHSGLVPIRSYEELYFFAAFLIHIDGRTFPLTAVAKRAALLHPCDVTDLRCIGDRFGMVFNRSYM